MPRLLTRLLYFEFRLSSISLMYKPSVVAPTSVFFTVQTSEGIPCTFEPTDARVSLMVRTVRSVGRLFMPSCNEANPASRQKSTRYIPLSGVVVA